MNNGDIKRITLNDMIAELEEFYETAGYEDFYNKVLSNMSESDIRSYYKKTFEEINSELEQWEQEHEHNLV